MNIEKGRANMISCKIAKKGLRVIPVVCFFLPGLLLFNNQLFLNDKNVTSKFSIRNPQSADMRTPNFYHHTHYQPVQQMAKTYVP